jgi:hypothetical protein
MKKLILSVLIFTFLGVQAQIFINTNENVKTNTIATPAAPVTDLVPVEVKTPAVEVETTPAEVKANTLEVETATVPTEPATLAPAEVKTTTLKVAATPVKTKTTPTMATTASNRVADVSEDIPPNAIPGKCYARCLVEDKYNYVNENVVDMPKIIKQIKLPALYKTAYDTVVVSSESSKSYTVPAEYEYVKEEVMVSPITTKWVKGVVDVGCLSANPADCQVMCFVEVPATYKTIEKKVLKNQAYTKEEITPMLYKIVAREVILEAEKFSQVEIPVTYTVVQKKVLLEKGGYQVWREILCGDDLTAEKINQIQKALKANGYYSGSIDEAFGPLTKLALIQYQKDKELPVGNLNIETLQSLGVNE